jgi:DNA-binding NarL/FixJ family response regulator
MLRNSVLDEISGAVHRVVHKSGYHMSPEAAFRALQLFSDFLNNTASLDMPEDSRCEAINPFYLTKMETQIAVFVAEGFSNRQIAEMTNLKESTVRNYISIILQKSGLKHRTQIAIYAFKNGLSEKLGEAQRKASLSKRGTYNRAIKTNYHRSSALQPELPIEAAT